MRARVGIAVVMLAVVCAVQPGVAGASLPGTDEVGDGLNDVTGSTVETVEGTADATSEAVDDTTSGVAGAVEETTSGVTGAVEETTSGVTGAVEETAGGTTGTVEETAGGTTGAVEETAGGTTGTVEETAGGTKGTVQETAGGTTGTVQETAGGTTGTVQETTSDNTGTVQDSKGGATRTVRDTTSGATGTVQETTSGATGIPGAATTGTTTGVLPSGEYTVRQSGGSGLHDSWSSLDTAYPPGGTPGHASAASVESPADAWDPLVATVRVGDDGEPFVANVSFGTAEGMVAVHVHPIDGSPLADPDGAGAATERFRGLVLIADEDPFRADVQVIALDDGLMLLVEPATSAFLAMAEALSRMVERLASTGLGLFTLVAFALGLITAGVFAVRSCRSRRWAGAARTAPL